MKKTILIILLIGFPLIANAGWLSFMGDVASISSAMSSGQQPVSQGDLKDVNSFLWRRVQNNQKLDGYKFLAEALEKSNKCDYLDTAAQTYFINGEKEKAIELYETRVLPTARATCGECEKFYKKMVGLAPSHPIPYDEIYQRNKQREMDKGKGSQIKQKTPSIEYAAWAILAIVALNWLTNLGLIRLKSRS